jgi:asparagine synthetase B (glutamine-hydrolysing)
VRFTRAILPRPLVRKRSIISRGIEWQVSGLLADRSRGTAILFNDRYGMHRLYYHASKDSFYFAAEAKAILAVRPELRRMDPTSLGEFVACGAVMEDRTLFEGIHLLPPASAWVFRNGALERETSYFTHASGKSRMHSIPRNTTRNCVTCLLETSRGTLAARSALPCP